MGSSNSTTSKPASAISKPRLRTLKSGTYEDLADTTVKYKIVQEITRKALQLLSTPEGKSSLVQVARIIVRETDQDQLTIKEEEFRQRPTWYIDRFLSAVAEEFPNIDLKAMHSDSQPTLYDWGTDVEKYSPRAHGYLELNETVLDQMDGIQQSTPKDAMPHQRYYIFKFLMIIATAHELVHFLRGYLLASGSPQTPPKVRVSGYETHPDDDLCGLPRGEAGRFWETILLGGIVESWTNPSIKPSDENYKTQAGIPYLLQDGAVTAGARLIPKQTALEFAAGRFTLPLLPPTSAFPITRNGLAQNGQRQTSTLRNTMNTSQSSEWHFPRRRPDHLRSGAPPLLGFPAWNTPAFGYGPGLGPSGLPQLAGLGGMPLYGHQCYVGGAELLQHARGVPPLYGNNQNAPGGSQFGYVS